jgi:Tfp pilus assembly protein PilZ
LAVSALPHNLYLSIKEIAVLVQAYCQQELQHLVVFLVISTKDLFILMENVCLALAYLELRVLLTLITHVHATTVPLKHGRLPN